MVQSKHQSDKNNLALYLLQYIGSSIWSVNLLSSWVTPTFYLIFCESRIVTAVN